jgi:hypothetical protein
MGDVFSPMLVVVVVAQQVAECGGARTEPLNFDFAITIVVGGWPSHVPCLPRFTFEDEDS